MKLLKATQIGSERAEYMLEHTPGRVEKRVWNLSSTWQVNAGAPVLNGQEAIAAQLAMHKRELRILRDKAAVPAQAEFDLGTVL